MGGLYFLFPTLLAVFFSFLVVRGASIALMMTGLDEKRARFQALSAFSGTGFTTKEAERIVNHPTRRRIITWLMIVGNAGIVAVIVTATSSLVTSQGLTLPINVVILLAGLWIIYILATRTGLARRWESFIRRKLVESAVFEEASTEDLLHLMEGYGLVRALISENSPFVGKSISKAKLTAKGLLVLGVERGGEWISVPEATEAIREGDTLVIYGSLKVLRDLLKQE